MDDLRALTADIVSAFVSNNRVSTGDLPGLIDNIYGSLAAMGQSDEPAAEVYEPKVTARKSLANRDFIVSMIDGKSYRSLKRHLGTHGLTPQQYRERYKLPNDYPMIAPGYSEARSAMAQRIGLGRKLGEKRSKA